MRNLIKPTGALRTTTQDGCGQQAQQGMGAAQQANSKIHQMESFYVKPFSTIKNFHHPSQHFYAMII
jgi:hypothetical protein